jgi:F-type H+-transporting ATPase subunit delta
MRNVRVDCTFPLDEAFTEALRAKLREETAAREVRIDARLMPELIAGCRLHIGSDCRDASLRGQLHKMAADLRAAGGCSW